MPHAIELLIQSALRNFVMELIVQSVITLLLCWMLTTGGSDPTAVDIATDSLFATTKEVT